jgi:hypothetical protein
MLGDGNTSHQREVMQRVAPMDQAKLHGGRWGTSRKEASSRDVSHHINEIVSFYL